MIYLTALLTLFISLGLSWMMIRRPVASDIPKKRSFHTKAVARGGGLAFVVAWLVFLTLIHLQGFPLFAPHMVLLVGSCTLMAIVGLIDDRWGLHAKWRLLPQVLIACVVMFNGFFIDHIPLPGISEIPLGFFGPLITFFWVVGFINAFNFMDGLNGLAGSAAALVALILLMLLPIMTPLNFVFYGLICALLGFLRFNFYRGHLFMGDSGSQFLGTLFALSTLMIEPVTGGIIPYYVIPLLFLPFLVDTSITFLNQVVRGRNVLHPHRMHLIHRLHDSGLRHIHVTLIYLALILMQGGFVMYFLPQPTFLKLALNFGFYIILAAIVYAVSYRVRLQKDG